MWHEPGVGTGSSARRDSHFHVTTHPEHFPQHLVAAGSEGPISRPSRHQFSGPGSSVTCTYRRSRFDSYCTCAGTRRCRGGLEERGARGAQSVAIRGCSVSLRYNCVHYCKEVEGLFVSDIVGI